MTRASLVLLTVLSSCKRDEPAPAPPAPSVTAAPSVAPAFVQLRPGVSVLGDPFTTAAKMSFDLAVGAVGSLRVELVDRIGGEREMAADTPDPRWIAMVESEVKPPRASIELRFENKGGSTNVVIVLAGAGGPSENYWPVDKSRRPSAASRLKAGVLDHPVILPSRKYLPIAGFAWSAPDAPVPDPLVADEAATEPRWILRVQFRPGA